jgi:hypothetical protein
MSRLGVFRPDGRADAARVRLAGVLDLLVAVLVTMLLWPFPLLRLTLSLPWSVHAAAIVVGIVVVHEVYSAASVAVWGRTPVMYLLDLGLAGRERPFGLVRSWRWALGWTVAVVPGVLGVEGPIDPDVGLPARFSGLRTATVANAEDPAT